jgi:putative endonuclease
VGVQSTKAKGDRGEDIAVQFILSEGMKIVETHYRSGRGEIDIVAREGDILVFCEVKTRESPGFGDPEYAVHRRKQAQIRRIAEAYMLEHGIQDQVCRFDVAAVLLDGANRAIRYYRNAF